MKKQLQKYLILCGCNSTSSKTFHLLDISSLVFALCIAFQHEKEISTLSGSLEEDIMAFVTFGFEIVCL